MLRKSCPLLFLVAIVAQALDSAFADDSVLQAEQQAFQRAGLAAAPSVVTIETIGGFDKLGEVRLNTGATTGTVVGADGWILSSAFNLAGQPQAIFVTLDDGRRVPAQRVATDEVRQLVLLKADATALTPIGRATSDRMTVGRWAIAVGRTYGSTPNVSVGLVSALGRIGGLAMQTDAKISPANYGGPLVNIRGDAMGILVPMSPKTTAGGNELAGIEWYDSGIGFAVPIDEAIESARRLREGKDLLPGKLGVSFTGTGLLDEPAIIKAIHPLGPADQAGLEVDDQVTAINGQKVAGLRPLKLVLAGLYAGESITISINRGSESLDTSLQLAAELPAYKFPWLGVMVDADAESRPRVREVMEGSPAAGQLIAGDVITSLAGEEVSSPLAAQRILQQRLVGEPVSIGVLRDGASRTFELPTATLPSDAATELALPELTEEEPDEELLGRSTGEVLDGQVTYWAYTPPAAAAGQRAGLLVWIADGGNALLPEVRAECHARNVALLVPAPAADDWTPGDASAVEATIAEVTKKLSLDSRRVAVVASGTSAVLGLSLAQKDDSLVSGLILKDPKLREPPRAVSPEQRLIWGVIGEEGTKAEAIAKFLEKARHPVSLLPDPFEDGAALIRWVDWLGRL